MGPASGLALDPHLAAVGLDDVLDDGQAKAGPAGVARAGFVQAVEALEDALAGVGGNPRAVVRHADADDAVNGLSTEGDAAIGPAILDGVLDQVHEDLFQTIRVGASGKSVGDLIDDLCSPLTGAGLQFRDDSGGKRAQRQLAELKCDLTGLQPGDGEQVFDEICQAVGMAFDGLQEPGREIGVGDGAIEEGFDIALDQRDGRAELMAHVGHEFAPGVLQLSDAREIVEDKNGALGPGLAVEHGGGVDFEVVGLGIPDFELAAQDFAISLEPGQQLGQFRSPEGFGQRLASHIDTEGELSLKGLIDQLDAAGAVQQDDALDHAVE